MTTAAKATAFGAISAGRVSEKDFNDFLVSQGKLQTLTGASAGAIGAGAGLMPLITGKEKNTAKDLEDLSDRLYEIDKLGGFKDVGEAAEQRGKSAGYVMKGIYTAPELEALTSAFAIGGEGAEAATRVQQLTRTTSAGMMRARKMNLGEDYKENSQTSYAYEKSLGITDQTSPFDRAMKITADVQRAEDEATKAGKKFYGPDYLGTHGFNNVQDSLAIMKLVGANRSGVLGQLVDKAAKPLGGDSEPRDAWKKIMDDPVYQQRASEIGTEAGNKLFGAGPGGVGTFKEQMYQRAYDELGGKGGNAGYELKELTDRYAVDPRELYGGRGSRAELEWEAQRMTLRGHSGRNRDAQRHDHRPPRGEDRELARLGKVVRDQPKGA